MTVRLERLTGTALRNRLHDLARLRISVFEAFPYLYRGDPAYEERYLKTYADTEGSVIVGAFDGNRLVGAATGLPLAAEPDEVRQPYRDHGFDPDRVFYFGESVLLPDYRGQGIGVGFFVEREAHARSLGRFDFASFCAVIRSADHPRRPTGYVPLDAFWRRRGFEPVPGLISTISWQDLDEPSESAKPMQVWVKDLRR